MHSVPNFTSKGLRLRNPIGSPEPELEIEYLRSEDEVLDRLAKGEGYGIYCIELRSTSFSGALIVIESGEEEYAFNFERQYPHHPGAYG